MALPMMSMLPTSLQVISVASSKCDTSIEFNPYCSDAPHNSACHIFSLITTEFLDTCTYSLKLGKASGSDDL